MDEVLRTSESLHEQRPKHQRQLARWYQKGIQLVQGWRLQKCQETWCNTSEECAPKVVDTSPYLHALLCCASLLPPTRRFINRKLFPSIYYFNRIFTFFKTSTMSSMLRDDTKSSIRDSVFFRTSKSGVANTRKMSITNSWSEIHNQNCVKSEWINSRNLQNTFLIRLLFQGD